MPREVEVWSSLSFGDKLRPFSSFERLTTLKSHEFFRGALFKLRKVVMIENELEYAGFWVRALAFLIDSIIIGMVIAPPLFYIYGWQFLFSKSMVAGPADFFLTWVLPAVLTIIFWSTKQATPGKMVFSVKIVDVMSGEAASTGQLIGRYFAYLISLMPLGLGFFWIAIDRRKQGWHDKLASTVVVRQKAAPVIFIKSQPMPSDSIQKSL